jgi:CRP-like cAMP-binding protein
MFRHYLPMLPIFQALSSDQLELLLPFMTPARFDQGQIIFRQDQPARYFHILLEGEVLVTFKPYDGPPLTVSHILPGEVFGWSAALRRPVYSATAAALSRSIFYGMMWTDLQRLKGEYPETGKLFIHALACGIAERTGSKRDQVLILLGEE